MVWTLAYTLPDVTLAGQETGMMFRRKVSKTKVTLKTNRPVVVKKCSSDTFSGVVEALETQAYSSCAISGAPQPSITTIQRLSSQQIRTSKADTCLYILTLSVLEGKQYNSKHLARASYLPGTVQNTLYLGWLG